MEPIEIAMSMQSLEESGAFSGAPVKKTVSWKVGDKKYTADVWVRPFSYHSAISEVQAFRDAKDGAAARIAGSIVDGNGKPIFTIGDITGEADPKRGALCQSLTMALLRVISEVNDLGKATGSRT